MKREIFGKLGLSKILAYIETMAGTTAGILSSFLAHCSNDSLCVA